LAEMKERFLRKEDVWDIDFREPKFSRDRVLSSRSRGAVRLSGGWYYTTEEWAKEREKVLNERLP